MNGDGTRSDDPFQFQDPQEEEIYRSLREKIGAGPAAFFKDACRLLSASKPLETRSHLIHHCLRELESALRDALAPARADELEGEEPDGNHERDVRLILRGLNIPEDSDVAQAWLAIPGNDNPLIRAHRRRLTVRRVDEEFRRFWRDFKRVLTVVLDRFEARYVPVFDALDSLLDLEDPDQSDVETLLGELPNNSVTLGYFFNSLEHPEWLEPLREAGAFREVQAPLEPIDQEGNVRFPPWPAGVYLANMASEDPETVRDIILEIPATKNPNVYNHLADAILEFPSAILADVVEPAASWLDEPYVAPILPNKLGHAVQELAEGGYSYEAIDLARSVFRIEPNISGDRTLRRPSVDTAFHSPWQYRDTFVDVAEACTEAAPQRAIQLLCDLLARAVSSAVHVRDTEPPEDYSSIWRPRVEVQRGPAGSREMTQTLMNVLVNRLDESLDTGRIDLRWTVRTLEERPYRIFHRIALYLLGTKGCEPRDLIEERMSDRELFQDATIVHEYLLLLEECWTVLSGDVQERYLEWVEEGPEDHINDDRAARWQYVRLVPIRDHLSDRRRELFSELNERFGPPGEAEVPGGAQLETGFVERPSPISVDELSEMSVEEIIDYVQEWEPSGEVMGATPNELAQEIASVVEQRPKQFSSEAARFQEVAPIYVGALMDGLTQAVKSEQEVNWDCILRMGEWIIDQDRVVSTLEGSSGTELGWKSVRLSTARLLREGFKDKDSTIPYGLRDAAWQVLEPLTDDPDPTPEREEEYSAGGLAPYTLSINTVRGEAIHAVFDFIAWVERGEDGDRAASSEARGIEVIPEARSVLEHHLDPAKESSRAVRSAYGKRFPFLVAVDSEWSAEVVEEIFPAAEEERQFWMAAWAGYINWNPPYTNVVPLLHDEYGKAVEMIPDVEEGRANQHLARHLMTMFWWDEPTLPIDEEDALIPHFFTLADDELRGEAIKYVGRSLSETEDDISEDIRSRLRELWNWRLRESEESVDAVEVEEELKAFGWWLTSEAFDPEWCLDRFIRALRLCPETGFDLYSPITTLVELAERFPVESIRAVELILRRDTQGWGITARRDEMRELLQRVLRSDQDEAESLATELINRLAAQGHLDFRDLLT